MGSAVGRMGRVRQPVLSLLPAEARSVGPSVGLLEGPDGGVVFVFGLATFSLDAPRKCVLSASRDARMPF